MVPDWCLSPALAFPSDLGARDLGTRRLGFPGQGQRPSRLGGRDSYGRKQSVGTLRNRFPQADSRDPLSKAENRKLLL